MQANTDNAALSLAYAEGADRATVASLHQSIGFELKAAEVHALLAAVQVAQMQALAL